MMFIKQIAYSLLLLLSSERMAWKILSDLFILGNDLHHRSTRAGMTKTKDKQESLVLQNRQTVIQTHIIWYCTKEKEKRALLILRKGRLNNTL